MIKYINDLLNYNSIEYCFVVQSLLGIYIFTGINIFDPILEICTSDNNFFNLKKLEEDGFDIVFSNDYIKIYTIFFDNIKTCLYISS